MERESILPTDYDGVFRFTNWTDEDFVGKWNSKEYRFPARSTAPINISDETPLGVQYIRKKFARDLAEREYAKSEGYGKLMAQERNNDGSPRLNSMHQAGTYSIETLAPFIQRCLEPLTLMRAEVTDSVRNPLEEKLSRSEDGSLNTTAIDKKVSLKKKVLES